MRTNNYGKIENHQELSSWHLTPDTDTMPMYADANDYKVWYVEIVLSDEGVPHISKDKDILCDFKQNIINHCLAKIQIASVLVTDNY